MTPTPEPLTPTQEDRDAAFSYYLYTRSLKQDDYRAVEWRKQLNLGARDGSEIVQAFARHRLRHSPAPGQDNRVTTAAINQNDAMRQELAHIGNLISELERAMRVDPANADGSWPDLSGRIQRLVDIARHSPAPDKGDISDTDFAWTVPRHATEEMMSAGLYHCSADMTHSDLFTAWHYMVDAAIRDNDAPDPASAHPAAQLSGDAVLREALEKIAALTPHPELDEGDPGQRCRHCGYRRKLSEPMEHGPHCAYVIASAALASPPVETGEG